jgi:hypothetical protein
VCEEKVIMNHLACQDERPWSDWGNPERIAATLRGFGLEPEVCWERMAAAAG